MVLGDGEPPSTVRRSMTLHPRPQENRHPARAAYAPMVFALVALVTGSWGFALGTGLRKNGPYVWVLLSAACAAGLVVGALLSHLNARRRRRREGGSRLTPTMGAVLGVVGGASFSFLPAIVQMMGLGVCAGVAGSQVVLAFRRLVWGNDSAMGER
jgi:hypothetical protein